MFISTQGAFIIETHQFGHKDNSFFRDKQEISAFFIKKSKLFLEYQVFPFYCLPCKSVNNPIILPYKYH